jgi:hypothetical protein
MTGIAKGYSSLKDQLDEYLKDLEADKDGDLVTSDPLGTWRKAATNLTKDILEKVSLCMRTRASTKEDALSPLRRAVGKVVGLNEAIARMEDAPEEEGLRALGRELSKVKKELMSLGRILMMSQDPSLAAGAHELAGEAEDAIGASQQKVRAASDISETGSVDLPLPRGAPVAGGPLAGQGIQPVAPMAAELSAGAARPGSEVADLFRCLTGAQANDSGWPVFNGRYVEYPRFRKEWWAYRRMYHRHLRDELVSRALKEKSQQREGQGQ